MRHARVEADIACGGSWGTTSIEFYVGQRAARPSIVELDVESAEQTLEYLDLALQKRIDTAAGLPFSPAMMRVMYSCFRMAHPASPGRRYGRPSGEQVAALLFPSRQKPYRHMIVQEEGQARYHADTDGIGWARVQLPGTDGPTEVPAVFPYHRSGRPPLSVVRLQAPRSELLVGAESPRVALATEPAQVEAFRMVVAQHFAATA